MWKNVTFQKLTRWKRKGSKNQEIQFYNYHIIRFYILITKM